MSKGLTRSMGRATPQAALIIKKTIAVRDLAISVAGTTGIGFGSGAAEGLPEGNILLLGCVANLSFAGGGADANLSDTWAGDYGVGTTPAGDATITGADVDIVQSTALAAATAEVSPITRGETGTTGLIIDNTAGAAEINVNLLIDDADISGTVAMLATGEIYLAYIMLGDD